MIHVKRGALKIIQASTICFGSPLCTLNPALTYRIIKTTLLDFSGISIQGIGTIFTSQLTFLQVLSSFSELILCKCVMRADTSTAGVRSESHRHWRHYKCWSLQVLHRH